MKDGENRMGSSGAEDEDEERKRNNDTITKMKERIKAREEIVKKLFLSLNKKP